jgi:rSAM/selenodomain-associated transferase 1
VTTVVVMAKEPRARRVKTRLCPPCTHEEAAGLAAAALADTFAAVDATSCSDRVLALDGSAGAWVPEGWTVVPQLGDGLAERLDAVVQAIDGPVLVVGMDTPQLTAELLDEACTRLEQPATDAVLGIATDGGFWTIGFRGERAGAFEGVTMSTNETGGQQRARLADLGLTVTELDQLRDVDTIDDAHAVAALIPSSRFARALNEMDHVP